MEEGGRSVRERFECMLLTLQMEAGAVNQGMQMACSFRKDKETDSFPEPPEGMSRANTLI